MKKNMIQAISGLLLLVLTVSVLSACGGKNGDGELTWNRMTTAPAGTTGPSDTAPVTPAGDALLTLPASDKDGNAAVCALDMINGLKSACGITVNTATETVIIMTYKTCFIAIEVGSPLSITNVVTNESETVEYAFPPYAEEGSIYVDARTLAEALGCHTVWNREEGKVAVTR